MKHNIMEKANVNVSRNFKTYTVNSFGKLQTKNVNVSRKMFLHVYSTRKQI